MINIPHRNHLNLKWVHLIVGAKMKAFIACMRATLTILKKELNQNALFNKLEMIFLIAPLTTHDPPTFT